MLNMNNICKTYQSQSVNSVKVFENFNMTVDTGEMVAITGRSGCGKSTLLAIIAGLLPIDNGEYYFCNKKITIRHAYEGNGFRRNNIGIVVQNFALISDMNVLDNIILALSSTRDTKKRKVEKAMRILEKIDLQEHTKKYPAELSGGQCQRVAIARAIISSPKLLLADEPTGSLDAETEKKVMCLMDELNQNGMTILIATHNMDVAKKCQRIINI